MKRLIPLSALLIMMSVPAGLAQTAPREIIVTGEGIVEAIPDMAVITVGVTHEAVDADAAMSVVSDGVSQILARLKQNGVEADDIQTRQISLSPVWDNRRPSDQGRPSITGFVASNTVMVRLRDLERLGGILNTLIDGGANNFNGLQFALQEPRPLMDLARAEAVADGIAKARLLADAAGVTLGAVQTITEQGARPVPMRMEMAAAAADASLPVAAGEISVQASVSMVFAIAE